MPLGDEAGMPQCPDLVFELEDRILDVIDSTFRADGWMVSSLQFDGCHVEHRADADLSTAMRRAEEAVEQQLGYKIQLSEKELFDAHVEDGEQNDALMVNELDDDE